MIWRPGRRASGDIQNPKALRVSLPPCRHWEVLKACFFCNNIYWVCAAGSTYFNIINEDILGSIEYACGVAGSKAILVLGHTKCGAVTSACKGVELGNITALLSKVKPAIANVQERDGNVEIEEVTKANVHQSIKEIREKSSILADLESDGKINIVGAVYHVEDGQVSFL